jgi:hypothetical protein
MCQGITKEVWVKIPADLSCQGREHMKLAKIDDCIAGIVDALQRGGIDMRGSCCGHGKAVGEIHLQDGRVLIIMPYESYDREREAINKAHGGGGHGTL